MPDPVAMVLASGGHGHGPGHLVIAVLAALVVALIVAGWMYYVRSSRMKDSRGEQP